MPLVHAPFELRTKTVRWLAAEAEEILQPGEIVQHQGYGFDRLYTLPLGAARVRSLYGVITDRRLIFIRARLGAFAPLRENKGVIDYALASISRIENEGRDLSFHFNDGSSVNLFVDLNSRYLSNQYRFLAGAINLLSPSESADSARHLDQWMAARKM